MVKVTQAVILAAGESSRFWPLVSGTHKSMYPIMDKPLLQYTLESLRKVGFREIIMVVSPTDSAIRAYFGNGKTFKLDIQYAVQQQSNGMADAILCARSLLHAQFAVLNASSISCDVALKPMLKSIPKNGIALAAATTNAPELYGIFRFEGKRAVGVVEKPSQPPSDQRVVGIYLLNQEFLELLAQQQGHYALEDALNTYLSAGKPAAVVKLKSYPEQSLKYPWHLFAINRQLMDAHLKSHRGKHVKIHKTASIEGKVWLGDNVRVLEHAVIKGPCYIGDNSVVGTHSLVREYATLGHDVQTGFRSEIKNSLLAHDIKLHTCFIGDSILDTGCRFGAGTIVANRRMDRKIIKSVVKGTPVDTGLTFFGTICGQNTRTGIRTTIMPGVKLGGTTIIGPNTMVMEDVPDHTTVYAEFQRVVTKRR